MVARECKRGAAGACLERAVFSRVPPLCASDGGKKKKNLAPPPPFGVRFFPFILSWFIFFVFLFCCEFFMMVGRCIKKSYHTQRAFWGFTGERILDSLTLDVHLKTLRAFFF